MHRVITICSKNRSRNPSLFSGRKDEIDFEDKRHHNSALSMALTSYCSLRWRKASGVVVLWLEVANTQQEETLVLFMTFL
jgi:predicted protein tyrosine phosphatase